MDMDVEFSSNTTLVRERHSALFRVVLLPDRSDASTDGHTHTDPLGKLWRRVRAIRKRIGSDSALQDTSQEALMLLTPESIEFYTSCDDDSSDSSVHSSYTVSGSGNSFGNLMERGVQLGTRGLDKLTPGVQLGTRAVDKLTPGAMKKDKTSNASQEGSTAGPQPELPVSAQHFGGHCFSVGVAISQVLRVSKRGKLITLCYHLNGLCGESLSPNDSEPLQIAFEASDEEEAMAFVTTLERAMDRFVNAMLLLGKGYPLTAACQAVLVTHARRRSDSGRPVETVVSRHPDWGMTLAGPASWSQGDADGEMAETLQVYLATPLGSGTGSISHQHIKEFWDGAEASFFVTVSLATDFRQLLSLPSRHMVRRHSPNAGALAASGLADGGPGAASAWTPGWGERALPGMKAGAGQQVRLHVCVERRSLPGGNSSFSSSGSSAPQSPFAEPDAPPTPLPPPTPAGPINALAVPSPVLHLQLALASAFIGALAFVVNVSGASFSLYVAASLLSVLCAGCAAAAAYLEADLGGAGVGVGGRAEKNVVGGGREAGEGSEWQVTLVQAEVVEGVAWVAAGRSHERAPGLQRKASLIEQDSGRSQLAKRYGFSLDTVNRFMQGYKDDPVGAEKALDATYAFRKANNAIDILGQPQPYFDMFKGMFTHGVLCLAKDGSPVWVVKAGEMKKGYSSYKASGATERDVARHLMFCQDFMYSQLDPRPLPGGRAIWVLDLKGVGLSDVGSSAMSFGLTLMGMMEKHFPERLSKAYVVNIPGFFSLLWRIAEPLTPPATRQRLRVLRSKEEIFKEMAVDMEGSHVPAEWGGAAEVRVYDSQEEHAIRGLVKKLNNAAS